MFCGRDRCARRRTGRGAKRPCPSHPAIAVCQRSTIDHTHVVDQSNILFYMRDGKVWSTHLTPACVNLTLSGFKMVGHPDQFCANAQTIEVLNGGAVCRLGNFEPYNDKAKQGS